jgi:hypothetical protein
MIIGEKSFHNRKSILFGICGLILGSDKHSFDFFPHHFHLSDTSLVAGHLAVVDLTVKIIVTVAKTHNRCAITCVTF